MAIRNLYTKAEQEMVDRTNRMIDSLTGWYKSPEPMVATKESMLNYAYAIDPKNPLWHDENYARNTRWGQIIAVPAYTERIGVDPFGMLATPDLGYQHMILIGEDNIIYKPVRENDFFRVWRRRPQFKDVTDSDNDGNRMFAVMVEDFDIINQKDELVTTFKHYTQFTFLPEPPKPYSMQEYGYTIEELEYIDQLEEQEEIRGSNIRYWEDVNINDSLVPIVNGPVSFSDMTALDAARSTGKRLGRIPSLTNRAQPLKTNTFGFMGPEFDKNPKDNLYYYRGFRHYEDRAAQADGEPRAFLFSAQSRHWLLRLVTNWMGDDGFITKFNYRHMRRNFRGETLIGRGKIVQKRIEGDSHLVDLQVWLENMRGNTTEAATVTVSLFSREVPYKWK